MQQSSTLYQGKGMRERHGGENKMEEKEKKQRVASLCPVESPRTLASVFFFFFNFEMLLVVPGGGLRLRMTHW